MRRRQWGPDFFLSSHFYWQIVPVAIMLIAGDTASCGGILRTLNSPSTSAVTTLKSAGTSCYTRLNSVRVIDIEGERCFRGRHTGAFTRGLCLTVFARLS